MYRKRRRKVREGGREGYSRERERERQKVWGVRLHVIEQSRNVGKGLFVICVKCFHEC